MRRLLGTALLALAACGGGGDGGSATAEPVWAVLGSSTAAGTGASTGHGWVDQLQAVKAAQGIRLQNLARPGTLSYEALPGTSVPPAGRPAPNPALNTDGVLAYRPQLVLLSFPTNDLDAGITADETAANLRVMRVALSAGGARALVLGTQPRDAFDADQRASQQALDRQLGTDFGACFVPLFDGLAGTDGRILPALAAGDGVHLNDAGHAVIEQRVAAALPECLR